MDNVINVIDLKNPFKACKHPAYKQKWSLGQKAADLNGSGMIDHDDLILLEKYWHENQPLLQNPNNILLKINPKFNLDRKSMEAYHVESDPQNRSDDSNSDFESY